MYMYIVHVMICSRYPIVQSHSVIIKYTPFSEKIFSNKNSLSLQATEEDPDHIEVVGEEEKETRVGIFDFCIFFLSYLLLALRFSSAGREMPGKTRTEFLLKQKYFVSENCFETLQLCEINI